jgi:transposase-like protein
VEAITNVLVEAGGETGETTTTDETTTEEKAVSGVVKAFPGAKVVCPQCGSDTWDNTSENQQRIAQGLKPRPRYRCKSCNWIKW